MAHSSIWTNPKTIKVAKALGIPEPHLVGHLERMWHTAYEHHLPDGDIPYDDVESAARWAGKDGAFVDALTGNFLEDLDKFRRIHNLYKHAPDYIKKRIKRMMGPTWQPPADNGAERRTTADSGRLRKGKERNETECEGTEETPSRGASQTNPPDISLQGDSDSDSQGMDRVVQINREFSALMLLFPWFIPDPRPKQKSGNVTCLRKMATAIVDGKFTRAEITEAGTVMVTKDGDQTKMLMSWFNKFRGE
jgi:hypothetical protein